MQNFGLNPTGQQVHSTATPPEVTTTAASPSRSPSKDGHYEPRTTQLTPTDGSVRSDEGYHSNGYHDEFTPPEDSSDSDSDNNYVLDFR